MIDEVPKLGIKNDPNSYRIRVLTSEEEKRLFSELPEEQGGRLYRSFADFLLYTGCRPSEAWKLKWEDIDLEDAAVTFWATKTSGVRTIPLAAKALEAVKRTKALGWDTPFQHISRWPFIHEFKKARKATGLHDVIPYTLRHTCATRLGKGDPKTGEPGMDVIRLMTWLGHSSPAMTKRYTHHAVDSLRAGANLFSRKG